MDDLEIKIAITYKVPKNSLTLNGLLRGLDRDRDAIMRAVLVNIFEALEEKDREVYPPDQYVWNGRQSSARQFLTSFGEVRYPLAQVTERKTGTSINPLVMRLKIPAYRHCHGEALEGPLGQAIHLSYRLAAKETQRIRGSGPGKSTLWSRMQELGGAIGWPSMKSIPFEFLLVDGTSIKKQGEDGHSEGKMELRLAWASEAPEKSFRLVGFWLDKDWQTIRQELAERLDYGRLRMLFADGENGIPEALLTDRMELQRCVWHGAHDFRFILYQDEIKGAEQAPLREAMSANPLFHLRRENLERLTVTDEPVVRKLVETIQQGFENLLAVLPAEKYPRTRTYVANFLGAGLTFLTYWLEHHEWPPFTINAAESRFSRLVNRIKRVGRRWSDPGLLNWLALAVRKIFDPSEWANLWRQYFQLNRGLHLQTLHVVYRWSPCIT